MSKEYSVEVSIPEDRHRRGMYDDLVDELGEDNIDSIIESAISNSLTDIITKLYDNRDNIEIEE